MRRIEEHEVFKTMDGSETLIHPDLGEYYHGKSGARLEANELYIKSSGLEKRLLENIHPHENIKILDIGLGLGYNALSLIQTWQKIKNVTCNIELVSLEQNPHMIDYVLQKNNLDARKNIFTHPENSNFQILWTILEGDAELSILTLHQKFDYFFHDPFSPKNNPKLWTKDWFMKLKNIAHPNSTLVTYSVARIVCDALTLSGWNWQKISAQSLDVSPVKWYYDVVVPCLGLADVAELVDALL